MVTRPGDPSSMNPSSFPFRRQKPGEWCSEGFFFWGGVENQVSPLDSDNVAIFLCLIFSFFCHTVIEFTNLLNLKIYIVKHLVFSHSTTYLSVALDTCVGCVTPPPSVSRTSAKLKTETVL